MKVEKNDAKCFDLVDEEDRYEHSLIATNDGKGIRLCAWRDQYGVALDLPFDKAKIFAEWLSRTLSSVKETSR